MSSGLQRPTNRREFFRAAARYGSLAAIGVAAAFTARPRQGQKCLNQGICSGCAVFAGCGLPAALSAKQRRVHKAQLGGEGPETGALSSAGA
jgi:hypothetical protein